MSKIIILDFSLAETHIFSYDENIWENGEEFIECETDLDLSNCQYMIVKELNIRIH